MIIKRMDDMTRGWFVGDFEPTVFRTDAVEVAVKTYRAGDHEEAHYHKLATELTAVISGTVLMSGKQFSTGDIIVIEPGEATDFTAITDAVNVVVKIPGAKNDKYIVGEKENA